MCYSLSLFTCFNKGVRARAPRLEYVEHCQKEITSLRSQIITTAVVRALGHLQQNTAINRYELGDAKLRNRQISNPF